MRFPALPRALKVVVVLAPYFLLSEAARAEDQANEPPKLILEFLRKVPLQGGTPLEQKLAERHNAAVDLLEARADQYKKGVSDLNLVLDAARLVVEAKLDLAKNPKERLEVLNRTLPLAKYIEERTRQVWEKGLGSKADYQRALLGRLSIEVEILKAQPQEAKQTREP